MSVDKSQVSIWTELNQRFRTYPDRHAVVTPTSCLTFRDLLERAERLALDLQHAGVGGERRAVMALSNGPDFLITLLALFRIGHTVGLASTRYGATECRAIQDLLHPDAWVTSTVGGGRQDGLVAARRIELPTGATIGHLLWIEPAGGAPPEGALRPKCDGAVLCKFTSGSTGAPKGIALSASNLIAEGAQIAQTLEITERDRIVAPVPLFHSYGFDVGVLTSWMSGATLVLRDTFIPRRAWEDLGHAQNTVFLGVPSMYRLLLECAPPADFCSRHVRFALSCTAPLAPDLIRRFADQFGLRICQHYGSSESGAATNHDPGSVLDRIESVGRPLRNVRVRVLDDAGRDVPSGSEGELVVQSPAVALGYIGARTSTTPLRNGVFHTGDVAMIDDGGFVYIRGRRDEQINVGGLKVYPLEVTQVLESHPAIREAAVCGMPLRSGDHAVYAAVSLRAEVSESELIAHCRSALADYKVPRRIEFMDSLPRGPSGKVRLSPPGSSS